MSARVSVAGRSAVSSFLRKSPAVLLLAAAGPAFSQSQVFTPGNLVVLVEGCGQVNGTASSCAIANSTVTTASGNATVGGYGDNQAAPITLFQFAPNGTSSAAYVNSLVLPQTNTGVDNVPVSGEYGSSSEGGLQLSGDGRYLTFMGYGIPATTYNASPLSYGSVAALAQSTSLTHQKTYTPVSRVAALVDAYGTVKSNSVFYNLFDTNNPRSLYSPDGTRAWMSGQGSGTDATGGVFYSALGTTNSAPTAITGLDTMASSSSTVNDASQDTRMLQIYNGQLYVSVDSKGGKNNARSYLGVLGTPGNPPTSTLNAGPTMLAGFGTSALNGKVTITSGPNSNGNGPNAGLQINISPESYFFAAPNVVYVTDTGNSKQTSANSTLGDGGLQKWVNSSSDGSGTWNLAYTLHTGLPLVTNTGSTGATGLYALAGKVVGSSVLLYATDYNLSDLDLTHLYGVTDTLSFTTASQAAAETFTTLATAPKDSNFKGVSFAPSPAPDAVGFSVESTQVDPTAQFVTVAATGVFTGGAGYPTSPITMQIGSGPVVTAGCGVYGYTGYCTVNYPVSAIAPGANTVTVQYAGDSTFAPASATGVINKTGTQNYVALAVDPVTSSVGAASVQLSVAASWSQFAMGPQTAGSSYFTIDNGTRVGVRCALNPQNTSSATCTATYPTTSLAAGYHAINFVLPSDGNFQQSVGSSTLVLK